MRKKRMMDFWCVYEHEKWGEVKTVWRWVPSGVRGVYSAHIISVEFDLFTPPEVQQEMMTHVHEGKFRVGAIRTDEEVPWV